MRALILRTGTTIEPFGEHAGESMVQFSTLRDYTDHNLAAGRFRAEAVDDPAGVAADDDELVLILPDNLFVSQKAVRDFERAARAQTPARLALRRTASVDFLIPVSDAQPVPLEPAQHESARGGLARIERDARERVDYDVFLVRGRDLPRGLDHAGLIAALRQRCRPVVVSKREVVLPVRVPILGDSSAQTMDFPITSTLVCELRHWVHILWLNQVAFGMRWMDLLRARKLWAIGRILSAFPFGRARVFKKLVRVGRGCSIHPTAHIEMSELGDGVVVGPRASIRNSFVGDGAVIGDHSVLLSSTVGAGAFITPKTFLVWSAAYPGATIGNYKLQVSLVGRDAHVNAWAGLVDAKLKGDIRVPLAGEMRSTGRQFLGSCVGHRAALAAKVLLQPGRMIPNDAMVVMRPDEVISEVPADLEPGVPLVRDHGTLVPLSTLKP